MAGRQAAAPARWKGTLMNIRHCKRLTLASSMAVLLALAGCNRAESPTAATPPAASPAAQPETPSPSAQETRQEAQEAVAKAEQKVQEVFDQAERKSREAGREASAATASLMGEINDAQVSAKVNTGLSVDKDLSASGVNVDSKSGVVTLQGKAPSEEARTRAADIARHVAGVNEVKNEIQVSQPQQAQQIPGEGAGTASMGASSSPAGSTVPGTASVGDLAITTKVSTGLSVDRDLANNKIDVTTKDGVVTLQGTAPTEEAKQRATQLARNVADVKEVKNELKVMKPG